MEPTVSDWTTAADAALTTAHALGQTSYRQAQAVEAAAGWLPTPSQVRHRAAALGLPRRGPGRPRVDRSSQVRLEVRIEAPVLGTLAEVAAAAAVSPAALAAQVLTDWARAGSGGAP
jgi:hypothetical protein